MEILAVTPLVIGVTLGTWFGIKAFWAGRPKERLDKWDTRLTHALEMINRHKNLISREDMLIFEIEHQKYVFSTMDLEICLLTVDRSMNERLDIVWQINP